MNMVYLAIVAGLAVAGLVPAVIAHARGRAFWAWWPYGTALLVVALPHALLLRPRDGSTDDGGRTSCPACGETLPSSAISCRYCGHELSRPFARGAGAGGRNGPTLAAGVGAADPGGGSSARRDADPGPLWSDEEFARISRMGPGEPEREPLNRRILGAAAISLTVVSVGAFAVAFMPAGAWFGDEQRSPFPEDVTRLPDGIAQHATVPDIAGERVRLDPVHPPPPLPGIPVAVPVPPVDAAPEMRPPPPPPLKPVPQAAGPVGAPGEPEAGDLALLPGDGPARVRAPEPPDAGSASVSRGAAPAAGSGGKEETGAEQAALPVPESAPERPPGPAAATPDTLERNSDIQAVGELVAWLQRRLASFGFYDGPIHGRADARTRKAIREWQQALEMTPSGNIDHALVVSLRRALPERSASETR